jgi:hypothetical protein
MRLPDACSTESKVQTPEPRALFGRSFALIDAVEFRVDQLVQQHVPAFSDHGI